MNKNRTNHSTESGNGQVPDSDSPDADLTAFALEQLSADETEAIKARLRDDPKALKLVDEVRTLGCLLRQSTPVDGVRPSDALREIVERRLDELDQQEEKVTLRQRPANKWNVKRLLLAVSVVSAIVLLAVSFQQWRYSTSSRTLALRTEQLRQPVTAAPVFHQGDVQHPPGERRETELAGLVNQVKENLNQQHYDVAEEIAQQAKHAKSKSLVAEQTLSELRTELEALSERRDDAMAIVPVSSRNLSEGRSARGYGPRPAVGSGDTSAAVVDSFAVEIGGARTPSTSYAITAPLGWRQQTLNWDDGHWGYRPVPHLHDNLPTSEQYDTIHENEFVVVGPETALSTFSIDVDTAFYANVRRFLNHNTLPPADAVRIEELVNYFRYDYPQPRDGDPFSVNMEVAKCPWETDHLLLRIGLKGQEIDRGERPASNLVFLLDVSGSMRSSDKLPLLKRAMRMLVEQLTENDRVTIVTYAGQAGLRLDTTTGDRRAEIDAAIESLSAGGSTNGSAGIELAYQKAVQNFIEEGTNRVILATDGDLNVGISDDGQLVSLIKEKATSGVFLTVLGFGTGNLKDSKLEKLADHGNGMYGYIDSLREARKMLVEQMAGSLVTIAKDVKIQVEFNPAKVRAYRLIGYENRVMAAQDFHDDTKDAGEIGAGHTVTALYELEPTGQRSTTGAKRPPAPNTRLKYQQASGPDPEVKVSALTDAAQSGELLTLSLRFKQPEGNESSLIEVPLDAKVSSFEAAGDDFRFASMVAAFGMLLRGSQHCGDISLGAVEEWSASALADDPHGRRAEFVDLVRRAKQLRGR